MGAGETWRPWAGQRHKAEEGGLVRCLVFWPAEIVPRWRSHHLMGNRTTAQEKHLLTEGG